MLSNIVDLFLHFIIYIIAALIPVVGLILGIIYIAKGDKWNGVMLMLTAIWGYVFAFNQYMNILNSFLF